MLNDYFFKHYERYGGVRITNNDIKSIVNSYHLVNEPFGAPNNVSGTVLVSFPQIAHSLIEEAEVNKQL